jgi:hypothetical protein
MPLYTHDTIYGRNGDADGQNVMPVHPLGMGWIFNGWDATDNKTNLGFRYAYNSLTG